MCSPLIPFKPVFPMIKGVNHVSLQQHCYLKILMKICTTKLGVLKFKTPRTTLFQTILGDEHNSIHFCPKFFAQHKMKKKMKLKGSSSSIKWVFPKDFTEDILFEILLHLPLIETFKFQCVSKVWSSLLSNPNFLRQWYKLNALNKSLPWGLVYAVISHNNRLRSKFTISCPELHSRFITGHRNEFSLRFLYEKLNSRNSNKVNGLYLRCSSNGLVLCTTTIFNPMSYYVCNPLTKKWVSLPPPPPPRESNWVVTVFHCDDCSSSSVISTSYQVFRIPKFEPAKQFKVEIFSSDSGEWNTHQVSSPNDITWDYSSYNNVVTHNGVLYWIQKQNRVLAYNFKNSSNGESCGNHCRLIDLPDVESTENEPDHDDFYYSRQCLGVSEGMICYGRITRMDKTLGVWVLDEEWKLLHKGEIPHDMLAEIESRLTGAYSCDTITQIQFLGFNPVDQNVVVLGPKKNIWSYNIRTQGYEQLCHPSFLATCRSSPCQMWLPFAFSLKPRPTILPPASWR